MRRVLAVVAVVVVLVGAGVVLVRAGSRDGAPESSVVTATSSNPQAGADAEWEVVEAAIGAATGSQRWLYLPDEAITEEIGGIATAGSAERIAAAVVEDVAAARSGLSASPGRVWWLVRPLAWELEQRSATEARVRVWVVTVLSAVEVAAPQADWMTVTVDLERVKGVWLVDDLTTTEGPTPMGGPHDAPWDAGPFDRALEGFTRLDGEPLW